jgi:hypothetical protein
MEVPLVQGQEEAVVGFPETPITHGESLVCEIRLAYANPPPYNAASWPGPSVGANTREAA